MGIHEWTPEGIEALSAQVAKLSESAHALHERLDADRERAAERNVIQDAKLDEIHTEVRHTNGRLARVEDDWWGPEDSRLGLGWRARTKEMYDAHTDRRAQMQLIKVFGSLITVMSTIAAVASVVNV